MSFPQQKSIITIIILAILGFAIIKFLAPGVDSAIMFATGIIIGGLIIGSQSSASPKEIATKTLYVGNLPYKANESVVRELFEKHATVQSVRLLKDKNTGKRRGFGFVEVAEKDAASTINALNEKEFQQRTLKVREAKQKSDNRDNNTETTDQSA